MELLALAHCRVGIKLDLADVFLASVARSQLYPVASTFLLACHRHRR